MPHRPAVREWRGGGGGGGWGSPAPGGAGRARGRPPPPPPQNLEQLINMWSDIAQGMIEKFKEEQKATEE
ncbi:hypothetical protein ACVGV7_14480, partial [Enterobacter intestinihominis]